MRRPVLIFMMLGLVACSETSERTYTVDELVSDEVLLSETIATCRNNPGDLRDTTNCRNAEAADGMLRLQRMQQSLGG